MKRKNSYRVLLSVWTCSRRSSLAALPELLRENLRMAYASFSAQEDIAGEENDARFEQYDDVFYENESLLLDVLKAYAENITL